jgi:hypothetical protein
MTNFARALPAFMIAMSLAIESCTPKATQEPNLVPTATGTGVPAISVATESDATAAVTQEISSEELRDNNYMPSDNGAVWQFAGQNSKPGAYTRTDTVTSSRDDGFTITTELKDVTYAEEWTCTEAALIDLEPGQQTLAAAFSGPSGAVAVTREFNSGITLPRHIDPAMSWQQVCGWRATSADASSDGSFTHQYPAMGPEVVTVPFGSFDAMPINVEVELEMGGPSGLKGTCSQGMWFVQDVGPVNVEGESHIKGVEFTDSMELVSYDSP